MGFLSGVFLAVALQAGPVEPVAAPVFNPSICAKKRVDSCGCHHVYGIRHCHPNRKSNHCEAQVKAAEPDTQKQDNGSQKPAFDPKKSVAM